MCKISKAKSPLLPDRMDQADLFVCDIFDAAPKGDMASMEHPIFSLSTKPDKRTRRYEHNGNFVEIKPSAGGLATMHDRDILIYCISQLIAGMENGKEPSQTVRFKAYDLLTSTNRQTNGQAYEALKSSMERLRGTTISTNIITGGQENFDVFGLIESAKIVRETREGRMQEVEIKLSDWVFNAISAKEVLTLNRSYFRLRKPLERRLYEIARKHCGHQRAWKINIELLRKKCGSSSTIREFRRLISSVVEQDRNHSHIPDYSIHMIDNNMIEFRKRSSMPEHNKGHSSATNFYLNPDTYSAARQEAPGWDVYELEKEWRDWITEAPRNPDAAFIGFCRKWFERRGRA